MSEAYEAEDHGSAADGNGNGNGNGNGVVSTSGGGGGGARQKGGKADDEWHKVTNVKKQRRQQKLSAGLHSDAVAENGKRSTDSKAFQALESEAEERRARRKARLEAAAAAAAAGDELSHTGEEDSDADAEHRTKPSGGGLKEDGDEKKSRPKRPKKPRKGVPVAAAAIDVEDLHRFLTEISESFDTLPDVQLIRCADYFAHAFAPVTNDKFAWSKILRESPLPKSIEIPYSTLPEPLIKTTSDWLTRRPADALSKFTVWLLKELLDEPQQKGPASSPSKPKVGIIVVLALLLRKRPEVLVQQAATVRVHFQGSEKLLTLAWAYGQAAQGDVVAGMALWVQNILPWAIGKSSNPVSRDIVLQFIENVIYSNPRKIRPILLNGVTRKGERLVPPASFEIFLRLSFPNESAKTKATERFQAMYPLVKELTLAGSQRSTKPVAQQLLPLSLAAAAEDVDALQREAIICFVWCLAQNPDCYKQWDKLHIENLKGSTRILKYLDSNWKANVVRLRPLEDFKKTLQAFSSKHRSGLKAVDEDHELESKLKAAESATKSLMKRTSRLTKVTTAMATLAVSAAAAYGFYHLSPENNPWRWDGKVLLSKTHNFVGW